MVLLDQLRENLARTLIRRSSTTCSRWAENYVVLGKPVPGPLRFIKHPWSRIWCDWERDWVGEKAAQMAMTNAALCRSLFSVDIKKISVLYILPKRIPDAADFSKTKFDSMVDSSPYLEKLFTTRNVGHKQAGQVDFFLRGSKSRSGLKSISTGLRVYDELDEMVQKNLVLADERSSGFEEEDVQNIKISTPTVPEFGIAKEIETTTKEQLFFRCPSCGKFTNLTFPECLVITTDNIQDEENLLKSHLICKECKNVLPHKSKPEWLAESNIEWVAEEPKKLTRGFRIPQLYSMMVPPWKIALSALKSKLDPVEETEFFNSKLGKPHAPAGARVTDADLLNCRGNYTRNAIPPQGQLITMGIDVGHKILYFHIDQWLLPPKLGPDLNMLAVCRTLTFGTVGEFEQLDYYMQQYQVNHAVIDIEPSYRQSYEFAMRHLGHAHLCRFIPGVQKKAMIPKGEEQAVFVNRTAWLDLSQGRYIKGKSRIILPSDLTEEYEKHIKALIRHEKKDDDGNPTVKYKSVGPDHFAFSRVYSELALPLAVSAVENQDVGVFL